MHAGYERFYLHRRLVLVIFGSALEQSAGFCVHCIEIIAIYKVNLGVYTTFSESIPCMMQTGRPKLKLHPLNLILYIGCISKHHKIIQYACIIIFKKIKIRKIERVQDSCIYTCSWRNSHSCFHSQKILS